MSDQTFAPATIHKLRYRNAIFRTDRSLGLEEQWSGNRAVVQFLSAAIRFENEGTVCLNREVIPTAEASSLRRLGVMVEGSVLL